MDPITGTAACIAQDGGIDMTAIASTVIAALALGFTAWQMWLQRSHNQKMSQPYLSGWTHHGHDPELCVFTLENVGLGPAVVTAICLEVDDQQIEGEGSDLIENAADLLLDGVSSERGWAMFAVGEMLPVSRKYEILSVQPSHHRAKDITARINSRAHLVIHYESILGDKFVFDSRIN